MSYNKYRPGAGRKQAPRPPSITVSPAGLISVNKAAYLEHLKGATYVELFYDADAHKIGLRPKKYKTRDALKLTVVGKKKGAYRVNGKPFLQAFGITLSERRKGAPAWDAEHQVLALKI